MGSRTKHVNYWPFLLLLGGPRVSEVIKFSDSRWGVSLVPSLQSLKIAYMYSIPAGHG